MRKIRNSPGRAQDIGSRCRAKNGKKISLQMPLWYPYQCFAFKILKIPTHEKKMKIINSILILRNTFSASEIVNYNAIRILQRLFDKETAQLR